MNTNVRMIKTKDGTITYAGTLEYWVDDSKSVEVDGEIYTKSKRKLVTKDVSDVIKDNPHTYEYDFKDIGITINILDTCKFWNYSLSKDVNSMGGSSTNDYVNSIVTAYNENMLPPAIKSVYTMKQSMWGHFRTNRSFEKMGRILDRNALDIPMYEYGYGNTIFYEVELIDVVKNITTMSDEIKDFFKYHKCKFKDGEDLHNINELFKLKIRFKDKTPESLRRKEILKYHSKQIEA